MKSVSLDVPLGENIQRKDGRPDFNSSQNLFLVFFKYNVKICSFLSCNLAEVAEYIFD